MDKQTVGAAFDAIVTRPPSEDRDLLLSRAMKGVGLDAERADRLVENLLLYGSAKVKGNVAKAVAEEVVQRFVKAGFIAEAMPVLAIAGDRAPTHCPICEARIHPTDDNKCPECGVYLHKITQETLDRKRIEQDERRKLVARQHQGQQDVRKNSAEDRERVLRERIRSQLEREYGLHTGSGGFVLRYRNWLLPLMVLGLGAAFGAGRINDLDKLKSLVGMGNREAAQEKAAGSDPEMVQRFLQNAASGPAQQALMEKLANAGGAAGDPLENAQAMVAALAQAGVPGAVADKTAGGAGAAATPQPGASAGAAAKGAGETTQSSPGNPGLLPEADRLRAMQDLAVTLAEMGQVARAGEVLGRMQALSGKSPDLEAALALRQARVRVEAWYLVHGSGDKPKAALDGLSASIAEIPQASIRAVEYAEAAAILAHGAQLPSQETEGLFGQAGKTLQTERDEGRKRAAAGAILAARGRGLTALIQVRASRGGWKDSATLTQELVTMAGAAKEAESAIRLSGYQYQALRLLGRTDEARKSLASALAQAEKLSQADSRARLKGWLYSLPEAPSLDGLGTSMEKEYRAADRLAPELQAAVLAELAQAYALAGRKDEAEDVNAHFSTLVNGNGGGVVRRWNLHKLNLALAWARYHHRNGQLAPMENQIKAAARIVL